MKNIAKNIAVFVVAVVLMLPATVSASSYQPQDRAELLAYLYGRLAQLQALLELVEERDGDLGEAQPRNLTSGSYSSRRAEIDVETLSAKSIHDDDAELRARVDFDDSRRATLWFLYGDDSDDLNERTSKINLSRSSDDGDVIEFKLRRLDSDERYYFRAVAEDDDDERVYGSVRSFRTDDDNVSNNSNNNNSVSSDADIDVDTLSAFDIDETNATMRARVRIDNSPRATLWFEYGTSRDTLDQKTFSYGLVEANDGDTMEMVVTSLDENQRYYYRSVLSDYYGGIEYGSIESFVTD